MEEVLTKNLTIDKTSWSLVRFGDVVIEPKESIKDPHADGIEHVVGLEHIEPENIHLKNSTSLEESTTFTKKFTVGDVLFGRRRAYLKKAAQASFSGICSGDITVFRANEKLMPQLLPFIVNNDKFFDYAVKHSAGGLSPRVKFKDLAEYEFLLPPKEQQAKLAELLWAMDELIERELEVLVNIKQTYLSKIEKELINKECQKTYFEDFGEIIRGVGYKPNDLLDSYSDDTCIILRSNNIFDSKINYDNIKILNLEGVKPSQILNVGDFAVCMSNGSKELVGKSAQYIDNGKNVSIGSFCAGFRSKDILSQRIVQHLFASESYRYAIKRILSGSAINNLKPSDIESLFLRIEQDKSKVGVLLNELDSFVVNMDVLESKISSSRGLQKSLINQIF
ncbi:restriction endonuclease subunit S [Aquimarina aggregata]|uniref:restriction endonuclease subunit S n=1 Tax=Aquimarina aggregata TaxID=1642818 RepID=UPI00248F85BA|nr:restriction endonuclease subunit S [Aquimarina aggregata]